MVGNYFYNETIRKTVIAFGTLFNNIKIKKFASFIFKLVYIIGFYYFK